MGWPSATGVDQNSCSGTYAQKSPMPGPSSRMRTVSPVYSTAAAVPERTLNAGGCPTRGTRDPPDGEVDDPIRLTLVWYLKVGAARASHEQRTGQSLQQLALQHVVVTDERRHKRPTAWSYTSRGLPACWIRPRSMTTTRSASASASSCEWVTCTNVTPRRFWRLLSSLRMRSRSKRSSADNARRAAARSAR